MAEESNASGAPAKYCSQCGTALVAGAHFCTECGAAIQQEAWPAQQSVPPPPTAWSTPTMSSYSPTVPNHLVPAILVTIFCCVPFGIVSIVYAAQVNGKLASGDYNGAVRASNNAKNWAWASVGAAIILYLVILSFNLL